MTATDNLELGVQVPVGEIEIGPHAHSGNPSMKVEIRRQVVVAIQEAKTNISSFAARNPLRLETSTAFLLVALPVRQKGCWMVFSHFCQLSLLVSEMDSSFLRHKSQASNDFQQGLQRRHSFSSRGEKRAPNLIVVDILRSFSPLCKIVGGPHIVSLQSRTQPAGANNRGDVFKQDCKYVVTNQPQ